MASSGDARLETRRRAYAAALASAAIAIAVSWPALDGGFVWDDQDYVVHNPHLAPLDAETVVWAATASHAANWHPLTWLSHAIDVALFGGEPSGAHAVNVALHGLNAALLMLALWRLTARVAASAAVAAGFALHPLHVESVAWIAERKDLLSTAFMLLALHAWIGWVRRRRLSAYVATTLLFAAALASKPMVVTFPFVLLLFDFWPLGRLGRRAVLEKLPWIGMSAACAAITLWAQSQDAAIASRVTIDLASRLENATVAWVRYLWHAVWPVDLGPFYPYPGIDAPPYPPWAWPAAALLLAALTAAAWVERGRRPWLLAGWLLFAGTLVPVIGLVQVGRQALADRYTYVPLTGLLLAGVWLGSELRRRLGARSPVAAGLLVALGLALLATWAALTVRQIEIWHDSETLWTHALRQAPRAPTVHFNRGNALLERGALDEAVESFRRSLEGQDVRGQARAHYQIGQVRTRQERAAEAIAAYGEAVRLAPQVAVFRGNLANALYRAGRHDAAEEQDRRALDGEGSPAELATIRRNLAVLLLARGETVESVEHARRAVELDPSPENWETLALGELRAGRTNGALAALERGLEQHPAHPGLHARLAQLQRDAPVGPEAR